MKRLSFSFVLILLATLAFGHGVKINTTMKSPTVILRCDYDGADLMSYAAVQVFSPINTEIEYQSGRTDAEGKFAFIPNTVGTWKFVVDDEIGHMEEIQIQIDDSFLHPVSVSTKPVSDEGITDEKPISTVKDIPILYKLIFGLGIIFGITGLAYWAKAKKTLNVENGE
ncbi:MAG: hypothetical protein JW737_07505 [Acidobacteria bacterium]|nr:hypothetical protein [Acidobacteriota bacterium]